MASTIRDRATARKTDDETPTDPLLAAERARAKILAEELAPLLAPLLASRDPEPEYRDEVAEARRLDVGVAVLRQMVAEGMPCVYVGDRRRYRASDVDAWLRGRGRP